MALIDNFLLRRSPSFTLGTAEENRTDLTLTAAEAPAETGRVRGRVIDSATGSPVGGVTVKIRTQSGDPVAHTETNPGGNYSFNDIAPGTYRINVALKGFVTPAGQSFTLQAGQNLVIDFSITPESRPLNVIFGIVTNEATGAPIEGATVGLVPELGVDIDLNVVRTNSSGQYELCEIPDSTQTLVVTKAGFYLSSFIPVEISGGTILSVNVSLQPVSVPQSTVNGFIRNTAGTPIANACVGLYLINPQGIEILQQITYTDSRGFYIFGRAPAGTYVVKAKSETVETAS